MCLEEQMLSAAIQHSSVSAYGAQPFKQQNEELESSIQRKRRTTPSKGQNVAPLSALRPSCSCNKSFRAE
ncbi:Zinc Finger Protein 18 [Manis pentadactyla]|nr:Zinc Finger Protein 18 [Manis pentadactyla]